MKEGQTVYYDDYQATFVKYLNETTSIVENGGLRIKVDTEKISK